MHCHYIERFIQEESKMGSIQPNKCLKHSSRCDECDILNRLENKKQCKVITDVWDNITAEPHPSEKDKFVIMHKYCYRHPIHIMYAPCYSNIQEASAHSKKMVTRAARTGV